MSLAYEGLGRGAALRTGMKDVMQDRATKERACWRIVAACCVPCALIFGVAIGLAVDSDDVVELRRAAENNDAEAQFNLGVSYAKGLRVQQDDSIAAKWFQRAADQGHASAQAALGELYGLGKGVSQDYSKAAVWLRRAADQGHEYAQFRLGYLYVEGAGVPQDFAKAIDWYRRAANQGYPSAQFNLGMMYITGKGVARDYVTAYTFISLAVANGLAGVEIARDQLAERMTAEQIAEAQRRVREWKRKPSPDGQ